MSVSNGENQKLQRPALGPDVKFDMATQTVTADLTLDTNAPTLQFISSAGARIVTLPAARRGQFFIIVGTGAGATTVKNAAATTIGSLAAGKTGLFVSDGTNWFGGALA